MRTLKPRCGKPMLRAKSVCGLNENHTGTCRSQRAVDKHRDKNTEYMRERRSDPTDRAIIGMTDNKSKRKRYAESREVKLKAHALSVKRKYGMSRDEYWGAYEFQNGRCAICMIATGRTKRLSVDHSHKCGIGNHGPSNGCLECVRGLLCSKCNTFIGVVRDNPEAFERGAAYLRNPPFQLFRQREAGVSQAA